MYMYFIVLAVHTATSVKLGQLGLGHVPFTHEVGLCI
jgi:hypothetical protein